MNTNSPIELTAILSTSPTWTDKITAISTAILAVFTILMSLATIYLALIAHKTEKAWDKQKKYEIKEQILEQLYKILTDLVHPMTKTYLAFQHSLKDTGIDELAKHFVNIGHELRKIRRKSNHINLDIPNLDFFISCISDFIIYQTSAERMGKNEFFDEVLKTLQIDTTTSVEKIKEKYFTFDKFKELEKKCKETLDFCDNSLTLP